MAKRAPSTKPNRAIRSAPGKLPKQRAITVERVFDALNTIAPFSLAAEWDNVGLLAGKADWSATRLLLAIDLTDDVAREALAGNFAALVAYHPPIFKGIRSITSRADAPTSLLPDLLAARVSIFALHTALDAALGGTNDVLLDAFNVDSRTALEPVIESGADFKLVVFASHQEIDGLRSALAAAGAGRIGHYDECSFVLRGHGTFRGDETTHPARGSRLKLEAVEESRFEMLVPEARLPQVVAALYANHSYEEPAFDLYPLSRMPGRGRIGLGRVGKLRTPQAGEKLLAQLRRIADCSIATVIGDLRRSFSSVTAAAGSFGVRSFRDRSSLYVTGEMKHHDALDLLKRGISAICLGHDASERPVLPALQERLRVALPGIDVRISQADRSPFSRL